MILLDKRLSDMSRDELIVALSKAYQVIWEINKKNEELLVKVENLTYGTNQRNPVRRKGILRSLVHGLRDFLRVLRGKK